MIDRMKLTFRCVRQTAPDCRRSFDVDESELTGGQPPEGIADQGFLPMVIAPEGWLQPGDAEGDDEFVCDACATPEEIRRHMAAQAFLEQELQRDDQDDDSAGDD